MSGIVVITPIVATAAWPVLVSAVSAVMVSMGYAAVKAAVDTEVETGVTARTRSRVEVEVANQEEIGQTLGREAEVTFEKDGVTVTFSRDVRGRLRVCVDGEGYGKAELEEFGRELAGRVIQQYAYNRIVEEMQQKSGMSMIEQSVDEDETIRIKLRGWED